MTENVRQRRGKKSSGIGVTSSSATVPSSTSPETTNSKTGNNDKLTPTEQLQHAKARLIVSRDRTADLHTAWRGQLFRLSLIILVLAMYQLNTSISACITEIKGDGRDTTTNIIGAEAIKLILTDSFCELLGVIISSLLAYFLALSTDKPMELEEWPYLASSALVPICLGCFFFSDNKLGCFGDSVEIDKSEVDDKRHQFPAVVIYHTIVTVASWFMKSGMQACEDHVKLCTKSIEDFARMDKKMEQKKKLKNASSKKK